MDITIINTRIAEAKDRIAAAQSSFERGNAFSDLRVIEEWAETNRLRLDTMTEALVTSVAREDLVPVTDEDGFSVQHAGIEHVNSFRRLVHEDAHFTSPEGTVYRVVHTTHQSDYEQKTYCNVELVLGTCCDTQVRMPANTTEQHHDALAALRSYQETGALPAESHSCTTKRSWVSRLFGR